jgi:hypothetical protein
MKEADRGPGDPHAVSVKRAGGRAVADWPRRATIVVSDEARSDRGIAPLMASTNRRKAS